MGIFDSIKGAMGKAEPQADVTTAPSQLLREAGLDPSGLKFSFGNASIRVSGTIPEESQRQKILDVLGGIPGIDSVQDDMVVADKSAPPPAAEEPSAVAAPPAAPKAEPAGQETPPAAPQPAAERTYTVVSGDTLWKIAEQMYGNGSHYMKIFEANTDVLEDPDRIFPGQELKIPGL
jgi:nucleoid-associated protein YgaU